MSRPLNECLDCDATWYPRGKDLSPRCPQCGSDCTAIVRFLPPPPPPKSKLTPILLGCLATPLFFVFVLTMIGFLVPDQRPGEAVPAPRPQPVKPKPPESRRTVSRKDLGTDWPLTVESGELERINIQDDGRTLPMILFRHDGKSYDVNGLGVARGHLKIDPIWLDRPDVPRTKMSLAPLAALGMQIPGRAEGRPFEQ